MASAPVPAASPYTHLSKPQKSVDMSRDIPASIDEIFRDLVEAIDDLEITGDPPKVSQYMHDHLVAAIEEIEGPDVDADMRLRESLKFLLCTAAMLRRYRKQQ
jgi:hypothetical protein